MKKSLLLIFLTLIFCLSFLVAAKMGSDTLLSIKNRGQVDVTGFAKQQITSDLGIFQADFEVRQMNLENGYLELSKNREAVSNFLEKYQFKASDVYMSSVNIEEKYILNERGIQTNQLDFYVLKQSFTIHSADVQKISKLATEISELLSSGIKIVVYAPQYLYSKMDDLKVEMIGRATANATERAQIIATKGKFKLGSIASVRVGVFQITPMNSTEVNDYGILDTTSIEKEIKSVVQVNYFVR